MYQTGRYPAPRFREAAKMAEPRGILIGIEPQVCVQVLAAKPVLCAIDL